MKLVLLGAPGAGKGTHAKTLMEKYGIPHISTGDIFRMNIRNHTELGQKAESYIKAGGLVPDELTVDLVLNRLEEPDCEKGFILDGFPRNLFQAEALTAALAAKNQEIDHAVHLVIDDEVIVDRMKNRRICSACGRSYSMTLNPPKQEGICDSCGGAVVLREDDKPETVKKRLVVYHEQTEPIAAYYRKLGKERRIQANQSVEAVYADLTAVLGD